LREEPQERALDIAASCATPRREAGEPAESAGPEPSAVIAAASAVPGAAKLLAHGVVIASFSIHCCAFLC
jgi:hypothetical protein